MKMALADMRGRSLPDGLDRAVFEPIRDQYNMYASVDKVDKRNDGDRTTVNGSDTPKIRETPKEALPSREGSYSDNEKQLLETMKTMQNEHDTVVRNYEGRINALMTKMHELGNIAEFLEHSGTKSSNNSPLVSPEETGKDKGQFPAFSPTTHSPVQSLIPTKPVVKPGVPMLTLEWKRLLLGSAATYKERRSTVWHGAKEADTDPREVESLFALRSVNSPRDTSLRSQNGVRLLTEPRTQAVNDVMNGRTFHLSRVEEALDTLDFSTVSIKCLQELVLMVTSNRDEIAKIEKYRMTPGDRQPLAGAERFLYDVTRIANLGERVRFCVFEDNFYNELFVIDEQLSCVQKACETLEQSKALRTLLELLLGVGNYMNGGTDMGQADGFSTNVVTKLKDIKSMKGDTNLLQYLVSQLGRHGYDRDVITPLADGGVTFPLPESDVIRKAASVSFRDLENKLTELRNDVKLNEEKMRELGDLVLFFPHARQKVDQLRNRMSSTKSLVGECKRYLCWQDDIIRHHSPTHHNRVFFTSWSSLLFDCKKYWTLDQGRRRRNNYKMADKMQWFPEPCSVFVPPHATSTPMTSPVPRDQDQTESTHKRTRATPNGASSKRSTPKSLGSPNSAFVTPTKRHGSLRRSAAVNAAFTSGKFHSPNNVNDNYHPMEDNARTSSPKSYSPRDSPATFNGAHYLRDSSSPNNALDTPRSHPNQEVVIRPRSPGSGSPDFRRHSALARLLSPVSDAYSGHQANNVSLTDSSSHNEQHSQHKMSPNRRRTIGGTMDKLPPCWTRRQSSETDSVSTTPPPVPPRPSDYVSEEDLDMIICSKARSRSPILSLEDESSQKLEQFLNNFHRQKSDDEQPYMRQRSFSEASTVTMDQGSLQRRKRWLNKADSAFADYVDDPFQSVPPSESSAPIKPLYKASLSAGPFPRPRAKSEVTSPGKNDYKSALRRVSMKNPTIYQNQIRT